MKKETSNIKIIKEYLNKLLSGNKEEAFELIAENAIWTVKGSVNVPTVGVRKGKKEIAVYFENFLNNFDPKEFNINHYFKEKEVVFVIGNFTHLINKTQKLVSSDWMMKFEIKNEKITSYKILEDSYALYIAFQN
ncbi:nuclear transport factor 2 family protein [Maribacter litoralis]|uniref:nuclear transport factor 2 family protein n=1 Tax=Maribacter litoralis TaxID=2059726 RepID=UPI003F5CBF67